MREREVAGIAAANAWADVGTCVSGTPGWEVAIAEWEVAYSAWRWTVEASRVIEEISPQRR